MYQGKDVRDHGLRNDKASPAYAIPKSQQTVIPDVVPRHLYLLPRPGLVSIQTLANLTQQAVLSLALRE